MKYQKTIFQENPIPVHTTKPESKFIGLDRICTGIGVRPGLYLGRWITDRSKARSGKKVGNVKHGDAVLGRVMYTAFSSDRSRSKGRNLGCGNWPYLHTF